MITACHKNKWHHPWTLSQHKKGPAASSFMHTRVWPILKQQTQSSISGISSFWAPRSSFFFPRRKNDKTTRLPGGYPAGTTPWIADDTTGTSLELTTVVRAVFQPDRRARYIPALLNIRLFPLNSDAENSVRVSYLFRKKKKKRTL